MLNDLHPTEAAFNDFAYQAFKEEFTHRYYIQESPDAPYQATSKDWLKHHFTIYQNAHPHARWFDLYDPSTIEEILDEKRSEYRTLFDQLNQTSDVNVQPMPDEDFTDPAFEAPSSWD